MRDLKVTLPFERLVSVAKTLGSQDSHACPPPEICWRHRDLEPYLPGDDVLDRECTECWLWYMINGG